MYALYEMLKPKLSLRMGFNKVPISDKYQLLTKCATIRQVIVYYSIKDFNYVQFTNIRK